ncbi:NAD(P)-binding protein [Xylariaceae sp. FL0255]|nr:NAD(P)-binding protein [Xylariaceae sp. FL0255]
MATFTFSKPSRKLTWLITGCSSGFGLSLARIVQAAGHTLIATSRNPSRSPELVAEVENKGGKWLKLDIDDPKSAGFINNLEKSGVKIDVLINNAGFCTHAPVETSTEEEIRAQMETMFFGPIRLIKAVIPHMRERRFGVIANFSSGAALDGNPTMGPYAGAKAGLDGLTKVLAKEVAAFNIRLLTVVLGTFNTSFGANASFGKVPIPEVYEGSMTETMLTYLKSGKVPINGDKDKAMKVVYDLVVGDGFGGGREAERFIALGTDMATRVKGVRDALQHSLDIFGDVTNGVAITES